MPEKCLVLLMLLSSNYTPQIKSSDLRKGTEHLRLLGNDENILLMLLQKINRGKISYLNNVGTKFMSSS